MSIGRLQGQVAWISGATSGIGEGTARLFAIEGAKVALVGLNPAAGGRIAAEINNAGGDAVYFDCDVTDEAQVAHSVDETARLYGGLQIVVNSAGVVQIRMLHEYTAEQWDGLMAVNLRSIFFSFKHAYPHLKKNTKSYVVNLGSISSFVGQSSTPAYTTSKGAVLQLSRSIALDYARDGIRCNCVCPGITDTPMLREHLNKTGDPDLALADRLHRVPLATALTPTDIARSILYLSCEDSAGVTGTSLVVDAGYTACAEWESG